ncbi:MAG: lipocalin family protein [Pseudomonadota bacterium]
MPPITTVESVDLDRFMGRWYVIANIPTFIETKAWNATEDYELRDADTIDTTFSYNKDGFDGDRKTWTPVATVRPNTGNAVWGMQFIWPFKAEFRVIWLNDNYSVTIIGRSKRDYVWVMARTPSISDALYSDLKQFLIDEGYDLTKLREVPQQWPTQ